MLILVNWEKSFFENGWTNNFNIVRVKETEDSWLNCRIPGPLIYISLNRNVTIFIYLVLQSTPAHVNKWAGSSAIASISFKNSEKKPRQCFSYCIRSQLSRIYSMRESHTCGSKIVISRIQTNFARPTDNSECNI